jgi:hypothetical protein
MPRPDNVPPVVLATYEEAIETLYRVSSCLQRMNEDALNDRLVGAIKWFVAAEAAEAEED